MGTDPLAEGGRTAAEVDCHIKDLAQHAGACPGAELVAGPASGAGVIVLHKGRHGLAVLLQRSGESSLIPTLEEEAAIVTKHLGGDQKDR